MWKRSECLFRRFPALRWLYPGMRVKRYALVAALGVLLLALGLAPLLPALPLWPWALALGLLGLLLLVGGIRAMNRSLLSALTEPEECRRGSMCGEGWNGAPRWWPSAGAQGFPGCLGA